MKKICLQYLLLCLVSLGKAQVVFRTVVPLSPVVVGESFQVQYIIEDAQNVSNFRPPLYDNFKVVAGPNVYTGSMETRDHKRQLRNSAYTLVPLRPGRFIIPGATATIDDKPWRSDDVVLEIISKEEAFRRFNKEQSNANSEYFLRPGEDAYEKIRRNLFLKMMVNKKNCYVGEPVLATFKLYSRLESRSDIVKNPGFYGFTVCDIVNLNDKAMTTEKLQGRLFDVHTIRKVQLYPLQPGNFIIDAMQVKNQVEFSRSAVNKKTEQEIVEGILGNDNARTPAENAEIFESNMNTEPVTITVKPAPEKSKPSGFNGATGHFAISARILGGKLARNEEGVLEVMIRGRGNFIQLNAPPIQWPVGIEVFEPSIKDEWDKSQLPISGSRTFRYAFISTKPGAYIIPPISFTFFNPDSGRYRTVSSDSLKVDVKEEERMSNPSVLAKSEAKHQGVGFWLIAGLLLAVAACGSIFIIRMKRKNTSLLGARQETPVLSISESLMPAYLYARADDRRFYSALNQAIWTHLNHYFDLSGSDMNKVHLAAILKEKRVDGKLTDEILYIMRQCEAGIFTNAELVIEKKSLIQQTKAVLEEIGKLHSEYL